MVHEGGPWTRSRWWSMDWGSMLCIYPVQYAAMSNLSTAQSHYLYNWRYAVQVSKIIGP